MEMYVVDQNYMRRANLNEVVARNPKIKFVIPDTGLVEMVKSDQWEETFRRNFEAFVPVVNRCYMSLAVQQARDLEIARRETSDGHLLPKAYTKLLRGAILESQLGSGPTMSLLRREMDRARQELKDHDLNASANRAELERLVQDLRSELTEDELKPCRQEGDDGRWARLRLTQSVGNSLFSAHMKKNKVPDQVASRLWKAKSMNLRWCYLLVHHALQWLCDGGLEGAKDEVVLNDVLDQDYVLLASFFDGIRSYEKDVLRAFEDLCIVLQLGPR